MSPDSRSQLVHIMPGGWDGCRGRPRSWPRCLLRVGLRAALAVLVLAAGAPAAASPLTTVGPLRVSEQSESTVLELETTQKPMFSVFKLERPSRLTVDLANAQIRGVPAILDVDSWAVSQVATTQFRTAAAAIARVMINFKRAAHYALRTEGKRLIITITAHQPRPKTDPAAVKLALEGARQAVARAQKDAEAERRSASSALDAASRSEREAAQAKQQAAEAKRLAEQSRLDTQKGQAELERARIQAARLKLDAEAARSLAQQRLDAVKAARTAAERERQQAEASRLLAEQQRKQSAAALAQLEQKRREAEAARLLAEKERREAAAARAQAQAAKTEAERLKTEAQRSRGEAERQRLAAEAQAAALKRALGELHNHTRDLKAAQSEAQKQKQALAQAAKLSREREAQVARLRTEIERARQLAAREAAGKQADAAATGKRVRELETKLSRALGLATKAEAAREATQRELAQTQSRRDAAEAARQTALARLRDEEGRRRAAEKAKLDAEARAELLEKAQREVTARKVKLDEMNGKLTALQQALAAAESRERAVRAKVANASEEAESSRQAVRQAELARAKLASEVKAAREREAVLVRETGKLRTDLAAQRRRAEEAAATVAELQRATASARSKLARAEGAARTKLEAELARAESALKGAERARLAAESARDQLAASIHRNDRQQKSAAASLRQVELQLADARGKAEATERKLTAAERKLRESQKQLADSSKQRQAEETRRQTAEGARRAEEKLLAQAEQRRRGAEQERDDAEKKLGAVRGALEKARTARLAEERMLAELKQAQRKASQELGRARTRPLATKERRGASKPLASVRDIRFVDGRAAARIEIQLDGQPSHSLQKENGSPVLTLEATRLPKLLQRTLDASEFKGPVELVTSYAPDGEAGLARVKVALRDPSTPSTLRQEGQTLVWEFAKPKAAQAAFAAGPGRASSNDTIAYQGTQVAPARTRRRANVKQYTGRRIDLDFKDADIHNILRLLTDVGNVNIITSDNVQGRVTIRMKNVPWDQALDVILRAKGFGQVREGNLIRVAPAADLEKEREAEIARMKQIQLLRPLETRLIPLSYAQASGILNKLKYTMSPRGALTFDARTNMVIARDIAGNLDLMERLIRNLDTQTPQVLIEARIVEARTNYSKEIGVQWGGSFVASQATGNSTGLVFPNTIGIGGGATDGNAPLAGLNPTPANPAFVVNMPASTGTGRGGAIGLTLGSVSGNININLRLSAAEANGDIRIVSAPKITTLDNVQARIEQGVTIPFSQVSAAGVQTTFQDAKLSLSVKPHVTADGSVMMSVQVTRNEPDFANTGPRGEPTILRKEAKTEMLVKDGDTSVIGGIYTTRTGRNYQRVPWFADIPILGWFFRQTRETADREEVLVFITPRIINRAQSIGR